MEIRAALQTLVVAQPRTRVGRRSCATMTAERFGSDRRERSWFGVDRAGDRCSSRKGRVTGLPIGMIEAVEHFAVLTGYVSRRERSHEEPSVTHSQSPRYVGAVTASKYSNYKNRFETPRLRLAHKKPETRLPGLLRDGVNCCGLLHTVEGFKALLVTEPPHSQNFQILSHGLV